MQTANHNQVNKSKSTANTNHQPKNNTNNQTTKPKQTSKATHPTIKTAIKPVKTSNCQQVTQKQTYRDTIENYNKLPTQ